MAKQFLYHHLLVTGILNADLIIGLKEMKLFMLEHGVKKRFKSVEVLIKNKKKNIIVKKQRAITKLQNQTKERMDGNNSLNHYFLFDLEIMI